MTEVVRVTDISEYEDDIAELVAANADDFVPYEGYGAPERDDGIDPAFFDNYKRDEETVFVAVDGEDVVGFQCVDVNAQRDDIPTAEFDDERFNYISLSLVDEAYRDWGIGSRLNAATQLYLSNVGPDITTRSTWEENHRQRRLYRKFGFEEYARNPEHRVDGQDTLYYANF